jgi:uncharacterized protein YecE (DUF72 family)
MIGEAGFIMHEFHVGTSGWSYDDWADIFYPPGLSKTHWFEYYASHFACVEINATFYHRFKDKTYEKWQQQAPEGFLYVIKASRWITHRKFLLDARVEIEECYRSASLLRDHFGLILLQLHPKTPYDPPRLRAALQSFKNVGKVAAEFRNKIWYNNEIRSMLEDLGAVFCASDAPRLPLIDWVTSEKAYIRMHGRTGWYRYNYSRDELAQIADMAQKMTTQGAREVYIFFNNDYQGNAIQNAGTLETLLEPA